MNLSITLVLLLPFATSMAAPTAPAQDNILRDLINPPLDSSSSKANNNNNMFGNLALASDQTIKPEAVAALKEALTSKVKSELITSLAALTPELTSTAGATGTNQLSQLNLSSGINNLVKLIVEKLLEGLMPRIFGQNPAPVPVGRNPGLTGGFNSPNMFGSLGSMNPMGMMTFGFLNNMFDFI